MTPDKFLVKASWNEAFASLTDIQLGQLMRAVFSYAMTGSLMPTTADQAVRVAFDFIRLDIDEDRAKYKARCERNRANAQKRWSKRKPANAKKSKPNTTRVRETHSAMPEVSNITPARQKLINERLAEYKGDKRVIRNAFELALHTPFLNGKGPKHWIADFDWILHPDHFPRILEGSYGAPVYPKAEQPLPERKQMSPEESQMARRQQAQRRKHKSSCARTFLLLSMLPMPIPSRSMHASPSLPTTTAQCNASASYGLLLQPLPAPLNQHRYDITTGDRAMACVSSRCHTARSHLGWSRDRMPAVVQQHTQITKSTI